MVKNKVDYITLLKHLMKKYETNNIAKALLFLGTLPWNGLPFELNEIRLI
jgi:hypothetical protein